MCVSVLEVGNQLLRATSCSLGSLESVSRDFQRVGGSCARAFRSREAENSLYLKKSYKLNR